MGFSQEDRDRVYSTLAHLGYDDGFCQVIASQMCTEWTARRMLGYLREAGHPREEDIADEMLGILSDREQIIKKHEMEYYQTKINEIYNSGFGVDEEGE